MENNNYAMYLRKSRADIELESVEKMETLKRHKKILNELAKKKMLKIAEVYEEIVSGESISDRPQMQRLLNDVYQKKYKGVLVVEVERLARGDTRDQGEVAEAFKFSNTLIVTPTKTYNPNNQFDEEYFEFGLFMSRREYKTIRRRLQSGLIESVKDGNYVGSLPPYGYDIVRRSKKERTLVLNDSSKYVQMIFDWFTEEKITSGAIARRLTNMGILTCTGKSEWNRGTIVDILQNNLYTGKVRWNRRKVAKEFDGNGMVRKKRRLTPDDYLIADGKHPAIISQEQFDKAQYLMPKQVCINDGSKVINPLAKLMYCKKCGKAFAYQGYNNRPDTDPRYIHRESMSCKVKSCLASEIIEAVVQGLKNHIADYELKFNNDSSVSSHEPIIAALNKELKACMTKRDELFDYFEKKIYTMDDFVERKAKNEKRIEEIKTQIDYEKANVQSAEEIQDKIITLHKAIDTLLDDSIDPKSKNDFLKDVIDRIEYSAVDLGRGKGADVTLDIYLK